MRNDYVKIQKDPTSTPDPKWPVWSVEVKNFCDDFTKENDKARKLLKASSVDSSQHEEECISPTLEEGQGNHVVDISNLISPTTAFEDQLLNRDPLLEKRKITSHHIVRQKSKSRRRPPPLGSVAPKFEVFNGDPLVSTSPGRAEKNDMSQPMFCKDQKRRRGPHPLGVGHVTTSILLRSAGEEILAISPRAAGEVLVRVLLDGRSLSQQNILPTLLGVE
ncbi:hypothetical protein Fcan01_23768 [Folsomia candida]|uniref:Uncharacterized protein n=1 Tax=Folsomia candida TaxID=158441 RepID=A0A226D7Q3_FOLCA|nr:hypothetical protein Fcan01_23768 [Folsomia candida]